jgi:NAD(P)-dependent dehydrogenase (short-subunit alcohol dehydrogenase family)
MKRFDSRTVIVTGGARGMEASHARLHRRGDGGLLLGPVPPHQRSKATVA